MYRELLNLLSASGNKHAVRRHMINYRHAIGTAEETAGPAKNILHHSFSMLAVYEKIIVFSFRCRIMLTA